ncbi:MAG TPA: site-specific DNA-methyltransferase [Polyangiaceae bacterium]|nr:site-specific DNA-methyltransferase [Polyangiaceae bacterium]
MPRRADPERKPKAREASAAGSAVVLEGDCLSQIAKAVELGGPFDLVYADPPFNAGGTRGAREGRGSRAQGRPAYADAWGGIDAFLSVLEPRLAAMRDALSKRGSLFLHLDWRAIHEAKVLADRVFGRPAFRGEIVWVPGNGARRVNGPSMTHQTILVYSRSSEMVWNTKGSSLRERYAETSLAMHFRHVDPSGRRYRERTIGGKAYRYFADEGRKLGSVWSDCPAMTANTPLTRETTGYPTQKPLKLLDRIVRVATHEDGRVLDPMCGSGTTVVAALAAGRRAIGIDQSPLACGIARQRLAALRAEL